MQAGRLSLAPAQNEIPQASSLMEFDQIIRDLTVVGKTTFTRSWQRKDAGSSLGVQHFTGEARFYGADGSRFPSISSRPKVGQTPCRNKSPMVACPIHGFGIENQPYVGIFLGYHEIF